MEPLISVILPVYQVEHYIENSLSSVCRQTYKNIEIIVVNDGTKDESMRIVQEVFRKYPDIRHVIVNQENKGVAAARNTGIRTASGEWIVCVDSDDYVEKDFLKVLEEGTRIGTGIEVSIVNYQMSGKKTTRKRSGEHCTIRYIDREKMIENFLTRKIDILAPAMMLKMDFVKRNKLYYNEKIKFSEDQHYIWQVMLAMNGCVFSTRKCYNYLRRCNSTMTSSSIEKILTGYYGYKEFTDALRRDKQGSLPELIMARWVFGTIHSSAKMMDFYLYCQLLRQMEYKRYMEDLRQFQDWRVRILSRIFCKSPRAVYWINKII